MIKENTACFRFSIREVDKPDLLLAYLLVPGIIKKRLIPQSISDSALVFYEFGTKEEKDKYLEWLQSKPFSVKHAETPKRIWPANLIFDPSERFFKQWTE